MFGRSGRGPAMTGLALALLLAGCGSTVMLHPTAPRVQVDRDAYECGQQSLVWIQGSQVANDGLWVACMRARGYRERR